MSNVLSADIIDPQLMFADNFRKFEYHSNSIRCVCLAVSIEGSVNWMCRHVYDSTKPHFLAMRKMNDKLRWIAKEFVVRYQDGQKTYVRYSIKDWHFVLLFSAF